MDIVNLLNRLQDSGISVSIEGSQLRVKSPKGGLTNELKNELAENKDLIISFLKRIIGDSEITNEIQKAVGEGPYVTSYGQKRLWVLQNQNPEMVSYNEHEITTLEEKLDRLSFEKAFETLVERHEILRTTFKIGASGEPEQHIHKWPWVKFKMRFKELDSESDDILENIIGDEIKRCFDLEQGPLIRTLLIKLGEQKHVLILTLHHIILDAWSMGIISKEVLAIYQAYSNNKPNPLPSLNLQYKDFAKWHNELIENDSSSMKGYWSEKLQGDITSLILPNDYPLANVKTSEGASISTIIDSGLLQKLNKLSNEKKVSVFSIIVACFKIVIHKITGQEDLVIAALVAGREHEDLQDLIGFFVNTVLLKNKIKSQDTLSSVISRVNTSVIEAVRFQAYPVENILEDLGLTKYYINKPISSVLFNKLDFKRDRNEFSDHEKYILPCKFDLEFQIQEYKDSIEFTCVYKKELFKESTINYLLEGYKKLLNELTENPTAKIDSLLIKAPQKIFANKAVSMPKNGFTPFDRASIEQTIHSRFEEVVITYSDKVAIMEGDKNITYSAINEEANRLAWIIIETFGNNLNPVALFFSHNLKMIIGLLGVLKSGNVYVPLDIAHPEKRLLNMISDASINTIVTDGENKETIHSILKNAGHDIRIIDIDGLPESISKTNPNISVQPENPAYILYTSGSTRNPKGVLQLHRNVLHFISAYTNNLHLSDSDRLSLLPYYTFDASIMDIFGALLNGASLHLYDVRNNGIDEIKYWIDNEGITVLHMVPTLFRYLSDTIKSEELLSKVRLLVLGGEAVFGADFESYKRICSDQCLFVNGLGPTESTVTLQLISDKQDNLNGKNIPVGYAVDGTEVIIVDDHYIERNNWEVGEIVYKSDYLSPGYINNPEATFNVFSIDQKEGLRVYRSGDLGRKLPDGKIEFIGRKDNQVKINGVRIEVSEIEGVLKNVESVKEAIVLQKDINKSKELIAYFTATGVLDPNQLKKEVLDYLPHYMVPSIYVQLKQLPLNLNGKVNRLALPTPITPTKLFDKIDVGSSTAEKSLTDIWVELLDQNNIHVDEDFFSIGGNSLKATQLIYKIHDEFKIKIDFNTIFLNPTIRELSEALIQPQDEKYRSIKQVGEQKFYNLSHSQKRMWILNHMDDERLAYILSGAYHIQGEFYVKAFEKAVNVLMLRHESLRTVFRIVKGTPKQMVLDKKDIIIKYKDWRTNDDESKLQREIEADRNVLFDLENGPLLRFHVYHLANNKYSLLFSMHHIISDGWSLGVLIREVFDLYNGFKSGVEIVLPDLETQYKDYVSWHNEELKSEKLGKLKNYWMNMYSDNIPELHLPLDYSRSDHRTILSKEESLLLTSELSANLKKLARKKRTSLYNIVLTAFSIYIHKSCGQNDFIIASPVSGRTHRAVENLIGLFINTLPYRIQLNPDHSFSEALENVKNIVASSLEHQDYPFDLIIKDLKVERKVNRSILYDIGFTWREMHELPDFHSIGLDIERINFENKLAQTDLLLTGTEESDQVGLGMTYNVSLFKQGTIIKILAEVKELLNLFLENEQLTISEYCSNAYLSEIMENEDLFPDLDL